jgi:hypothetical protein
LEFDTFYTSKLEPVLQEFEQHRISVKNKLFMLMGICMAVALLVALPVFLATENPVIAILILVACIVPSVIIGGKAQKEFVQAFKHQVVSQIAAFVDESIVYSPEGKISQGEYRSSQLFKQGVDRYTGEDLFTGMHDKTAFRFSELHTEYKTETRDSKGNRRTQWHTIFQGVFFIADFNKHFKGLTVVLPDTVEKLFGGFGRFLQETFKHSGEMVKLEDPDFERFFVVYGSDQIEARYILSHSLMRRILEFKVKSKADIYLSFHHSNVYVAISSTRDRFEPRVMKTIVDKALCRQFLEDLEFLFQIVDDLNLNTRIWTKE